MSRHASLETLSFYLEGTLRRRRNSRVAAHLSGCSSCTRHVQDLRQLPAMLSNVAFPPIPDHLSARIEIAISAESTTRVPAEGASGEASRRDLPARAGRSPRRRWQLPGFSSPLVGSLAAVGAAVVIAGGAYEIATNLGASSSAPSAGSAQRGSPAAPVRNGAAAGSAAAAGRVRYGPEVRFQHDGKTQSVASIETSTNFEPARLQAQAQAALQAARAGNLKYPQNQLTSPYAYPQATTGVNPGKLTGCVGNVAAGRDVLLVDVARYQGKPATIIVVAGGSGGSDTVYAAGPACSAASRDILAQLPMPKAAP